jgi:hypothetical protein
MRRRFASVRVAALVVVHVFARPALWWTALRMLSRTARTGWWRHAPYLPVPDRAYVRFRIETAYGPGVLPEPRDVVAYLRWCREREHCR